MLKINDEKKYVFYLIFTSIFFIFLVSPFYNFPLNDDAGYSHNVKTFLDSGKLEIGFGVTPTATAIFHILYGSFFTKIFGFSYPVLRISVMLLGITGIVGMYLLLRSLNVDEKKSFLGALLLLLNPFYYNLSHTFMTDVPFITIMIFALFFYIEGFKRNNLPFLIAGNIFTLISFGVRQVGVFIFISFITYLLLYKIEILFDSKFDIFEKSKRLTFLVISPSVLFYAILYWFNTLQSNSFSTVQYFALGLRAHFLVSPLYFGLILFPFAILYLLNWKILVDRKILILIILFSLLIFIPLQYWEKNIRAEYKIDGITLVNGKGTFGTWGPAGGLPLYPNIITAVSLGPIFVEGKRDAMFPDYIWVLITILSVITILFLMVFFIKNIRNWTHNSIPFIYFAGLILLLFTVALRTGVMDRYFLVFVPVLIALFMESIQKFKYVIPCMFAALLIFGAWSIIYTHDYMEANEAKWEGINYLLDEGIKPEEINGGMEFGDTYLWDHVVSYFKWDAENPNKNSFFNAFYYPNATYTISFSMLPNNSVEKEIHFNNLLRTDTIYVLKRNDSDTTKPQ